MSRRVGSNPPPPAGPKPTPPKNPPTVRYQIEWRKQITINTDPQRRCYNGCNFSEETVWTAWASFGRYSKEDGESSIASFQLCNPSHEYRLVPTE